MVAFGVEASGLGCVVGFALVAFASHEVEFDFGHVETVVAQNFHPRVCVLSGHADSLHLHVVELLVLRYVEQ